MSGWEVANWWLGMGLATSILIGYLSRSRHGSEAMRRNHRRAWAWILIAWPIFYIMAVHYISIRDDRR